MGNSSQTVNPEMIERVERLHQAILTHRKIVFFGGAGVSTESGIPDFRSQDGLWNQKYKYPPEEIVSHGFFMRQTAEFYDFYREKMIGYHALPNAAHKKLAEMEKRGILSAVITQNIDGLHQDAGSIRVLELHGSTRRNYCMTCGKLYPVETILKTTGIPRCTCGGIIKPDVVLYEEPLNDEITDEAIRCISSADLLIVAGTSLRVYPAAGLLRYYRGEEIYYINMECSGNMDNRTVFCRGKVGEILGKISLE